MGAAVAQANVKQAWIRAERAIQNSVSKQRDAASTAAFRIVPFQKEQENDNTNYEDADTVATTAEKSARKIGIARGFQRVACAHARKIMRIRNNYKFPFQIAAKKLHIGS